MSYLIQQDYKKSIQSDNLQQIIGSDSSLLSMSELAAQEEITSHLTQKYDLSQEFTDTTDYDVAATYKATERVKDNTGVIYYAAYPQPLFDYTKVYKVGDRVFWKDKVYTCLIATVIPSPEQRLQFQNYSNIPLQNIFPDDPFNGAQYWGTGSSYQVEAGQPLTDTTYWTKGDNRSQQMVLWMVDITLYHVHSRISPRNIPELRVKRYDEAIAWCEKAAKGTITANLPLRQVRTGGRISFGGAIKNNNRY